MSALDEASLAGIFRRESARCVATLIRMFGDIDLAEESVQDAFVVAAQCWSDAGIPPNPGGWLTTTARNRAIDRLRREALRHDLWWFRSASDPRERQDRLVDSGLGGEPVAGPQRRDVARWVGEPLPAPRLRVEADGAGDRRSNLAPHRAARDANAGPSNCHRGSAAGRCHVVGYRAHVHLVLARRKDRASSSTRRAKRSAEHPVGSARAAPTVRALASG